MQTTYSKQRHNFTKLTELDLEIKDKHRKILTSVLFYRVLRTRELFKKSGYFHGIKSFHKLIARFKEKEFIGIVSESHFSEQFIYPKEKLLREYKGKHWRDYSLHDESLSTLKLYWQLSQVYQWIISLEENFESDSYINNEGPNYDFLFDLKEKRRLNFALYAYFPPKGDEAPYFKGLQNKLSKEFIDVPILFTREWDIHLQRCLTEYFFAGEKVMRAVAWCHLDESFMTRKEILSAPLMTLEGTTTLQKYLTKHQGGL